MCKGFSASLRQVSKSQELLAQIMDEMQKQPIEEARRSMKRVSDLIRVTNKKMAGQVELLDIALAKYSVEIKPPMRDELRKFLGTL
jgi:hypothetical protein